MSPMLARLRGALVLAVAAGAAVFFARLARVGEEDTHVMVLTAGDGRGTICVSVRPDAAEPDAGGLRVRAVLSRVPVEVDFARSSLRFREDPEREIGFPAAEGLLLVTADRSVVERPFAFGRDLAGELFELARDAEAARVPPAISFDALRRRLEMVDPGLRALWE